MDAKKRKDLGVSTIAATALQIGSKIRHPYALPLKLWHAAHDIGPCDSRLLLGLRIRKMWDRIWHRNHAAAALVNEKFPLGTRGNSEHRLIITYTSSEKQTLKMQEKGIFLCCRSTRNHY